MKKRRYVAQILLLYISYNICSKARFIFDVKTLIAFFLEAGNAASEKGKAVEGRRKKIPLATFESIMPRNAALTARSRSEQSNEFPLLVPDILVPSQYYGQLARRSDLTPEKKLQVAVLESAVYDIQRYRNAGRARERRLFRESYTWFASEDDKGPFTFITICHSLELDPIYIRRGVLSAVHVTQEN